jgi:hypothetical protein
VIWNNSFGMEARYGVGCMGIKSCWGGGGEAKFWSPFQIHAGVHTSSYAVRTGCLFWGKSDLGVAVNTHPKLVPRLRKE